MRLAIVLVSICAQWQAMAYPAYYPFYGSNLDSYSIGSSDSSNAAMVLSRFYQPYYNTRGLNAGMAFMYQPPAPQQIPSQGYYQPAKRPPIPSETNQPPPQQNEVYYPQAPEDTSTTLRTELTDATERTELTTTLKTIVPELVEPEVEEVEPQRPKKRVSKKKQVKKPVDEEEDDEVVPKMPGGMMFPMFFGWGRSAGGGGAPGAMAVANAYSTGRGGVATSHATAYGPPSPDTKY